MRIKEFIIHNYKSIRSDIKKCHVIVDGSVTILIGANNSGKTNILEALSKFSSGNFLPEEDIPYTSEAFKWDDANQSKLPMVEVTFVLDDGDSVRLQEVHPELGKQDTLTLLRDCGGHLSITDPKIDTVAVRIQLIDQLKAAISKLQRPVRLNMAAHNRNRDIATPSSRRASSRFGILFAEINNFDHALTPADVAKTQTKFRRFRRALSNLEIQTDRFDNEVARPLEDIDDLLGDLAKYAESQPDEELLSDIIPSFMLVDATPEHWLKGEYYVDELIENPSSDISLSGVRRLLSLADIDLNVTKNMAERAQMEALERGSAKVTDKIQSVWREDEELKIRLEWSPEEGNNKLLITIQSSGHRGSPEQRGNGFRWFLEFYLLYATGKFQMQPLILLLEEPGNYLHPSAQEGLKNLIRDDISVQHPAIYTTHLPGMYDPAFPEHSRGVRKSDTDIGVTIIESSGDPENQLMTWEVAMKSIGYSQIETRIHPYNILLEGVSGWIYYLTFARLFAEEHPHLSALANGLVQLRACGGTQKIKLIIPFVMQESTRSVISVDGDDSGRQLISHLETNLGFPNPNIVDAFTVTDVDKATEILGVGNHEIEDFFGQEFYSYLVNETFGLKVAITPEELDSNSMLTDQIKPLVESRAGVSFLPDRVAWKFQELANRGPLDIPADTNELFLNSLNRMAGHFHEITRYP